MADLPQKPPGSEQPAPDIAPAIIPRKSRKKQSLKIDRDAVTQHYLKRVDDDLRNRQPGIDRREDRYAKY